MNLYLAILDKRKTRLSPFPRLVENVDTRPRAIFGDAIFLLFCSTEDWAMLRARKAASDPSCPPASSRIRPSKEQTP